MQNSKTFDQMAVRIMLTHKGAKRDAALAKLAQTARQALGLACPTCGSGDVDDNGWDSRIYLTYCCRECGEQWDADGV